MPHVLTPRKYTALEELQHLIPVITSRYKAACRRRNEAAARKLARLCLLSNPTTQTAERDILEEQAAQYAIEETGADLESQDAHAELRELRTKIERLQLHSATPTERIAEAVTTLALRTAPAHAAPGGLLPSASAAEVYDWLSAREDFLTPAASRGEKGALEELNAMREYWTTIGKLRGPATPIKGTCP